MDARDLTHALLDWNRTSTNFPRNRAVQELFEDIARQSPDRIALAFGGASLTYGQLNKKANRLAWLLRQRGVGPDTLVGCCLERSLELVIGILAILKAGGAYVPLDSSYPRERLAFMLEDTRISILLTQERVAAHLSFENLQCISVNANLSRIAEQSDENPPPVNRATDLAYVMYTSGSTGLPKGVMVEHRSVVRLVRNTNFLDIGPDDVFLQFAPTSFDASVLELWAPLLNGGKLAIMPAGKTSLEDLGRAIREYGVSTLWLTAGLFHAMVDERLEDLAQVRQLLAGGDVLSPQHVRKFAAAFPKTRLINGYGPTEGTTFTCCHTVTVADLGGGPIPIGRPIANTRVYILDSEMRPTPIGEPGELCVAGDGLARGYWNRSDLTAEKFVSFRHDASGRVYKTGDLARYRRDGTIEFLGRVDQQVKLSGFRIEPGEIEAALRCHPSVADALVTIRDGPCGDKRLAAYVVASSTGSHAPAELREFLRSKLPAFMIPSTIQTLASFPLCPNGKVDRSQLPGIESRERNGRTARPEAGIEGAIARAWVKVLHIDRAGLDENFFDLGGDSLQLIQVCSELQKTLPLPISITDLFEFPTVRELSKHLRGTAPDAPANGVDSRARKQREAQERRRTRIKQVSA